MVEFALIVPLLLLIVFGIIAEQSIGMLFTAAIIPGITQALLYAVVIFILVRMNPALAPAGERAPWPERLRALSRIWGGIHFRDAMEDGYRIGHTVARQACG